MRVFLFCAAAALLTALVIWAQSKRNQPPPTIVLGEQFAKAGQAEEARLAAGPVEPNPLPADLHYDRWAGDSDLSNPAKRPLDDALSALSRRYAASDATGRAQIRAAISMGDFYTLLLFSQRAAVFALRERHRDHIVNALNAVAMIEMARIDPRDASRPLGLLLWVTQEIGANPDELFAHAASLAEPRVAQLILSFPKRPKEQWALRNWLFALVQTDRGAGFVARDTSPYQPTYPMDQIGLAMARWLRADKYEPSVTVAASLPAVWLSQMDDSALKQALAAVRGGVSITGSLRPNEFPDSSAQFLLVCIVELADEAAADSLYSLFQKRRERPSSSFAIAGAKEGRLFSLAVARSIMAGKPAFETQSSMDRFSIGMGEVLKSSLAPSR